MNKEPRDLDYLQHILDAIARIEEYINDQSEEGFLADGMLQDAVIRNIEIIGEAANRLSKSFVERHNVLPWVDIAGMRHRLIHGYFNVNLETVWRVIEKDLPELKGQIDALLRELRHSSNQ